MGSSGCCSGQTGMAPLGRFLILSGAVLLLAGFLILAASRLGIQFGRIPGDIRIERNNLTCVFALGTSIVLSILLTIIVNVAARFLNK